LETYRAQEKLKGFRHIAQGEADPNFISKLSGDEQGQIRGRNVVEFYKL